MEEFKITKDNTAWDLTVDARFDLQVYKDTIEDIEGIYTAHIPKNKYQILIAIGKLFSEEEVIERLTIFLNQIVKNRQQSTNE